MYKQKLPLVLILLFSFFVFSIYGRIVADDDLITFRLVLRQCNADEIKSLVKKIGDVNDPLFGRHLKPYELREMMQCENYDIMKDEIYAWLNVEEKNENTHLKIINDAKTSIVIQTNAYKLKQLFPEDEFYFDENENRIMLVNESAGQPTLPFENLKEHIRIILGFEKSEKWKSSTKISRDIERTQIMGHLTSENILKKKVSKSRPVLKNPKSSSASLTYCETGISTIMEQYGIPYNYDEYYQAQVGIAEFGTQLWGPADLSLFLQDQCPSGIPQNPLIQFTGDMFNKYMVSDDDDQNDDDEKYPQNSGGEANLDIQLVAGVAQGVPIASYRPGGYDYYGSLQSLPLSWQLDVLENDYLLPPIGPYVWSMSYGFPENFLTPTLTGFNYNITEYIELCETNFAQFASLGVSIIVSSGDDGVCNGNPACEADPKMPTNLDVYYPDSQCNSFVASVEVDENTYRCTMPMSYFASVVEGNLSYPGTQCSKVWEHCPYMYDDLYKKATSGTTLNFRDDDNEMCHYHVNGIIPEGFNDTNGMYVVLNSNCTCNSNPDLVTSEESGLICHLDAFQYDQSIYKSAYWANYPATSRYVTAVASTTLIPESGSSDDICHTEEMITTEFSPGGGFSNFISLPSYQMEVVSQWASSTTAKPDPSMYDSSMRGYPDISAFGQNIPTVDNGEKGTTGGTSASAPIIASIIARLNNLRLKNNMNAIGELNPHLYNMPASAFQKISKKELDNEYGVLYGGNNMSYHDGFVFDFYTKYAFTPDANLPWDPALGLGTPIWSEWEKYFVPPSTSSPTLSPTLSPPASTPTPSPPASTPTPSPPASTPTPSPPASTPTPSPTCSCPTTPTATNGNSYSHSLSGGTIGAIFGIVIFTLLACLGLVYFNNILHRRRADLEERMESNDSHVQMNPINSQL